jgi:hypothetical protein
VKVEPVSARRSGIFCFEITESRRVALADMRDSATKKEAA